MWWITLFDLWILKNPWIPEMSPTWSWYMIFLMYWIWIASCWEFLHLGSSVILASNILLLFSFFCVCVCVCVCVWYLCLVLASKWWWLHWMSLKEIFWNSSKRKDLLQIFDRIYLWNHQVWDFCSLLNTVSISVLVIHLFIFSISPWFNLWWLYFSKNLSISSRLTILLTYTCS